MFNINGKILLSLDLDHLLRESPNLPLFSISSFSRSFAFYQLRLISNYLLLNCMQIYWSKIYYGFQISIVGEMTMLIGIQYFFQINVRNVNSRNGYWVFWAYVQNIGTNRRIWSLRNKSIREIKRNKIKTKNLASINYTIN